MRRVWSLTPRRELLALAALLLLGLGLRLLIWRWHTLYPLGGDEREYFEQALTWLQGKGYIELPLMRPPLYTVFLAVVFQLFDSQVQRVRLVQALISTGTIGLTWLWTRALFAATPGRGRIALLAAALTALCYTFAANATELLTETLFVAGLTLALWLLVNTARAERHAGRWATLAGLAIGALCLLRSVALPLIPLAALWLVVGSRWSVVSGQEERIDQSTIQNLKSKIQNSLIQNPKSKIQNAAVFVLTAALVVVPWTIRNYVRYDALIVIDTTGAENLWLDNDPAGREAVKRQLYALGDDRGARQALAMERGRAAILADPARFIAKGWVEAQRFVALEYFDDLRARRAIWVPPLEVWLRLLLGDGIWLLTLCGGIVGLWLGPGGRVKWLLVPWAMYIVLTGLLFHVELRYRLPLYPALLPYAAWTIRQGSRVPAGRRRQGSAGRTWWSLVRGVGAGVTVALALGLLLLHRPYLSEGVMLARKHYHLWQAGRAEGREQARAHAEAALRLDPDSALARVALGLSAPEAEAQRWWREAAEVLPAHPYAHLLLGNALRRAGDSVEAQRQLAWEDDSLEDLQRWSRQMFAMPPQQRVAIGDGLDLGAITGFYAPPEEQSRWTTARATIGPLTPGALVELRLARRHAVAGPPATVRIALNGVPVETLTVGPEWQVARVAVPEQLRDQPLLLTLETTPFRPRDYDRASPDNRALGVRVDWVATVAVEGP